MKTLGRILIILMAFAIVMGITYMIVNSSSSSSTDMPEVLRGEGFAPPAGERPALDGAEMRGAGWAFGLVKNIGIVAMIVAMITMPKSFMRRKAVPVRVK